MDLGIKPNKTFIFIPQIPKECKAIKWTMFSLLEALYIFTLLIKFSYQVTLPSPFIPPPQKERKNKIKFWKNNP